MIILITSVGRLQDYTGTTPDGPTKSLFARASPCLPAPDSSYGPQTVVGLRSGETVDVGFRTRLFPCVWGTSNEFCIPLVVVYVVYNEPTIEPAGGI